MEYPIQISMNTTNIERDAAKGVADALLPLLRSDCQAWRAMEKEAEGWRRGVHRLDVLSLGLVWKTIPIKTLRHVTAEGQSTVAREPTSSNPPETPWQEVATPGGVRAAFKEAEEGS